MTDADVERAVRLLDEWPRARRGRLGWNRLKAALEKSGPTWSRQTLQAKPEIAEAFRTAKKKLRSGDDAVAASTQRDDQADPPIDPAVELLQRKIAGLEAEVARLTAALGRYDERFIRYQRNAQLDDLAHAYAITTHKAQGSQFRRVVVPIARSRLLDRTLLYTAMTRAQEQVVFVGDRGAFETAILELPHVFRREVGLAEHLLGSGLLAAA